jgi:hypothetical protein
VETIWIGVGRGAKSIFETIAEHFGIEPWGDPAISSESGRIAVFGLCRPVKTANFAKIAGVTDTLGGHFVF